MMLRKYFILMKNIAQIEVRRNKGLIELLSSIEKGKLAL